MQALLKFPLPGAKTAAAVLAACLAVLALVDQAQAIPTFSRKYRTSCITCHKAFPVLNNVGEAFRRNGYQFPTDDELLVKEEPVPLGNESYKDMWPNTIWPSDLPHLPPIFIRAQQRMIFHTDPAADGQKWDMDFPHELVLGGAGTFGPDISAWWELEAEPSEEEIGVERAFIQFSNLFAWDPEEDDEGMHEGNCWFPCIPRYALNLRIGRLEPQVLPHYASQHARLGIQQALPIRQRYFGNRFRFEPAQSAVELHGIIAQYNSYAVGFANGGNSGRLDDNNHKDVYFRVSRKWFGYPLDGVIGQAEAAEGGEVRGQNPEEDEAVYKLPGLDYWRAWDLETGFFGWWGFSDIFDNNVRRIDYFRRIGVDARLQWYDWDIWGLVYWGHDTFAGRVGGVDLGGEDHVSYSIQADRYWKPWLVTFVRYEETNFDEDVRKAAQEGRVIPGVVVIIRQNLRLQSEWIVDTTGKDTGGGQATDQLRLQLDYAY